MSDTKVFPNGFDSWRETHYVIVEKITLHVKFWQNNDENLEPDNDPVFEVMNQEGFTGLWTLAEQWTDEFENLYKGAQWGIDENLGEFFEVLWEFFDKKVKHE